MAEVGGAEASFLRRAKRRVAEHAAVAASTRACARATSAVAALASSLGDAKRETRAARNAADAVEIDLAKARRSCESAADDVRKEARLLREVREVVVMQDEVAHPAANFFRPSPDSR